MYFEMNKGQTDLARYASFEFQVKLLGNIVSADRKVQCDVNSFVPYIEIGGVQPSTSGTGLLYLQDAGANFPTLDSDASPAVWAFLLLVGDADPTFQPVVEILRDTSGSTNTIAARGNAFSGVTLSNNVSMAITSAGMNLALTVTYEFVLRVTYKRLING